MQSSEVIQEALSSPVFGSNKIDRDVKVLIRDEMRTVQRPVKISRFRQFISQQGVKVRRGQKLVVAGLVYQKETILVKSLEIKRQDHVRKSATHHS
jgi:hypothetical protein